MKGFPRSSPSRIQPPAHLQAQAFLFGPLFDPRQRPVPRNQPRVELAPDPLDRLFRMRLPEFIAHPNCSRYGRESWPAWPAGPRRQLGLEQPRDLALRPSVEEGRSEVRLQPPGQLSHGSLHRVGERLRPGASAPGLARDGHALFWRYLHFGGDSSTFPPALIAPGAS